MTKMEFESEVGSDGVLTLRVALPPEEASGRVRVTIQPVSKAAAGQDDEEWHRILRETYGACAGMGLERPDQGEFEVRDPIE